MSIDWITVSAQIINFLILVWLLKRFLYQPVLRAMDAREQRVTQRLKDADQREQAAEQQRKALYQQQAELEQNRDKALKDARQEADNLKHGLLNDARAEVAEIRQSWQQQAELEKGSFLESLQQQTANGVVNIARKALRDLADADLETQLLKLFINKLNGLSEADIERLQNTDEPISVVTSFALSKPQQDQLKKAIRAKLAIDSEPQFTVSSELGFGVQLNAAEQRLAWNLSSYLDDLGGQFDKALANSKAG